MIRHFDDDASLVFIGPPACGKSSLAIMASAAFHRPVVEANDFFIQQTGLSRSAFRDMHGLASYREKELELIETMLSKFDRGHILVSGPGVVDDRGAALLRQFAEDHPVIYVRRELDKLQAFPGVSWAEEMVQNLHNIYRHSSNFEYFNLSEHWGVQTIPSVVDDLERMLPGRSFRPRRQQTLQNTKTDLLRFLKAAFGPVCRADTSFHTLSSPLPESRVHTNCLGIPLSAFDSSDLKIGDVEGDIDSIELIIDAPTLSGSTALSFALVDMIPKAMAMIRRQFSVPVILHVSLDRAALYANRSMYNQLIHLGLRFAPEYLTVNLRLPHDDIHILRDKKGRTKIIGDYLEEDCPFNFWNLPFPNTICESAKRIGCDMVRICKQGTGTEDNFACWLFSNKISQILDGFPVIAYNTGHLGYLSMAFNPILSPVSDPILSLRTSNSNADLSFVSFTACELRKTLFSCHVLNPMTFYLVGVDISTSLSPAMHSAGFARCGIQHHYELCQTESLTELRNLINTPNFGGASISLPFKPEAACLNEYLSKDATIIGAVNTLLPLREEDIKFFNKDMPVPSRRDSQGPIKAFYGANTDWMGMYACILRYITPANSINPKTAALVIGAGGMARAAVFALAKAGIRNIFIFNRTAEKARNLCEYYDGRIIEVKDAQTNLQSQSKENGPRHEEAIKLSVRHLISPQDSWPQDVAYPSIITSTIPAAQARSRIPIHWLVNANGGLVLELSYRDRDTMLMQQMREDQNRRWVTVDPLEILYEQACAQFELFTGIKAPRRCMWEACLRRYMETLPPHSL